MENRNEFNLGKNITEWMDKLSNNNLKKENILELESHLLDSIVDLKSKGLTEEEAYLISRKRIGNIDDLNLEFGKVNKDLSIINTIKPYLKGILIYFAFLNVTHVFLLLLSFYTEHIRLKDATHNLFTIFILITTTILFFSLIYKKFKKNILILNRLNSIPILSLIIIVAFVITFYIGKYLILSSGSNHYYITEINFSIYKVIFITLVLIVYSFFYLKNRKLKIVR